MMLTPMTAGFFIRKGLHDHSADPANKKPTLLDHMQRNYNMLITWAMQHRIKVLHKVSSSLRFALKAQDLGADAITLHGFECAGRPQGDFDRRHGYRSCSRSWA